MSAHNWQILSTLSGKGGVGKTTLASSLGYSFAQMGFKTLLIDLDVGLRNLDLNFQLQGEIVFDLEHILKGIIPLEQALITPTFTENLSVITSSLSRNIESIPAESFKNFLEKAKSTFEIILLDAPAGVNPYMLNLLQSSDKMLLVSQPHAASIRSIDKLLGLLQNSQQEIHWVINRYNAKIHTTELIEKLEAQVNFKCFFKIDDMTEVSLAASSEKRIDRYNTPTLINQSMTLAQRILSKDNRDISNDKKKVITEKKTSWWPSWLSWPIKIS